MLKPPCELGPLAIEIELFDFIKSSSSIFITSNELSLLRCFTRFARMHTLWMYWGWVGMRMLVTPSLRSGVGRGVSFCPASSDFVL